MIKGSFFLIGLYILTGSIFLSCRKERSCESCVNGNKPPVANAGRDTTIILPTDSVALDGSTSHDPDGNITQFLWAKISGPVPFNINTPASSSTKVKNLIAGTYLFELTVTDNGGLSAKDTVMISVDSVITVNHSPIAYAGPDQTIVLPVNSIMLNGSFSFDADNNITSYLWTKISGPSSFNISNQNAAQTQVTNIVQGIYQFELKVTDAGNLFAKDTMQVTVTPPPTEIIYTGLEWYYWHDPNDPYYLFDEIYLWVSDTSNMIPDVANSNFRVWVKRDAASNWEEASSIISNGGCTAPFWYNLAPDRLLIELCYPWDLNLVGKKGIVKVIF